MSRHHYLSRFLLLGMLSIFSLTACTMFSFTRDLDVYAFQTFASKDEQIRYMLADMQLGGDLLNEDDLIGPPLYEYLRIRVPVVDEALQLWEQGVRVVNIERFYHSRSTDTIMVNGHQAVIYGLVHDLETSAFVDPRVIILTTDAPMAAPTITPEPTSQLVTGYATIQGMIAYPSEGWCPEMNLYARGSNGEQSNYSWNDGQCSFSFTVQAPAAYTLFAWTRWENMDFGFMLTDDNISPKEITVGINEVVTDVMLIWCDAAYVPIP